MIALESLRRLVEMESPSADKTACEALAAHLHKTFLFSGTTVQVHATGTYGPLLEVQIGSRDERPALVLCHYDTVWPLGTVRQRPFRVEGDRAYGPGVFDMKASLVVLELALRSMTWFPRPVVALLTPDEEIGSPMSRALIETRARQAAYVLVMEPPLAGGVLKLRRKGTGKFHLHVEGRAAHAGLEPEKGVNALVELAHHIIRISALGNSSQGTTVNVGLATGGSAANVVPETAEAVIDVRAWTCEEGERVSRAIHGSAPVLSGAKIRTSGGLNRPPMSLTAAQESFFERARIVAAAIGADISHGAAGGGSDANFTTALGIPTLDGLGCLGAGAHADYEYIEVESIESRRALLQALLAAL